MDTKKKAQAAWAVLLALLALLFIPSLPGGSSSGSESPTSDPAPEESGQQNEQGNEEGTDGGTWDSGEDWQPEDGGHTAGPETDPNEDGTQTPDSGSTVDDDWQPEDGGHSPEPGESTDDGTTYGNDGEGTQDLPGNPLDGYPGHYDGGESGQFSDIPGFDESILDGSTSEPNWLGKMARGPIQWAFDNPEAAVLIVGAPIGAYLITASGVTAVGTATAGRLAAAGVTRRQAEDAEAQVREFYGVDEDSTTGGTGDVTEPSGSQDVFDGSQGTQQDGAVEEPDDSGSTVDDDWQPEDGGHDPGPTIDPDGGSDDSDSDDGSSSDPWDDGGESVPDPSEDWQPEDGGHDIGVV